MGSTVDNRCKPRPAPELGRLLCGDNCVQNLDG